MSWRTLLPHNRFLPVSPKIAPPVPDLPIGFGYNCAWLAIRSGSVLEVALALRLSRTEAANWAGGLERAQAGEMFVSPVVSGWVLAISSRLPEASQPPSRQGLTRWLTQLSQRFGEAEYFGSNRVVECQAWARARQGQLMRAYAYLSKSGATLWNVGPKTPEELALGLNFFDETSPEASAEGYWQRSDLRYPNEKDVLAIARRWSVDTSFSGGPYSPGVGVAGVFKG
jgi:hypothetical protein